MSKSFLYFDVDRNERDSAIRYLLGAILRSRSEVGVDRVIDEFDEDVNIYLAHLLFAVALPEYHELAEPYLSNESSDVLRSIKGTEDRTIRYFIFKVNADHLLVHLALFDDLAAGGRRGILQKSPKHFSELARLYYEQAAGYHARIYRKKTGVGDVLNKLSRHFNEYSEVLKLVRRDYLHFVTRFGDEAFDQFMQKLNHYERESSKKAKTDRFLDLYSQWLRTKDPLLKQEIRRVLRDIRYSDPEFGKGVFDDDSNA